jgi:hypothetical protein
VLYVGSLWQVILTKEHSSESTSYANCPKKSSVNWCVGKNLRKEIKVNM